MQHAEVSRVVAATPQKVYELVSDLPRMGEWSPENTGGTWIKGAIGPAVGAKFKGKNRKGAKRWSTIATVVIADPAKEFAFDVSAKGFPVARWGFRLAAEDGGTRVTEYWDDHRSRVMAKVTGLVLGVPDRGVHNSAGMEQTLARLADAAV
jgi:hypothetical protein